MKSFTWLRVGAGGTVQEQPLWLSLASDILDFHFWLTLNRRGPSSSICSLAKPVKAFWLLLIYTVATRLTVKQHIKWYMNLLRDASLQNAQLKAQDEFQIKVNKLVFYRVQKLSVLWHIEVRQEQHSCILPSCHPSSCKDSLLFKPLESERK